MRHEFKIFVIVIHSNFYRRGLLSAAFAVACRKKHLVEWKSGTHQAVAVGERDDIESFVPPVETVFGNMPFYKAVPAFGIQPAAHCEGSLIEILSYDIRSCGQGLRPVPYAGKPVLHDFVRRSYKSC